MKHVQTFLYALLFLLSAAGGTLAQNAAAKHHSEFPLNCQECHACKNPTYEKPCLRIMPNLTRSGAPSKYSLKEAPEKITIDLLSSQYGPVLFSHKDHASMAQMGTKCETCHHHNPPGKILACSSCHDAKSNRPNGQKPSLKAAYHQLCIGCHKSWDGTWQKKTQCETCHAKKGSTPLKIRKLTDPSFPEMERVKIPPTFTYKSDNEDAPIVTFHHGAHAEMYINKCETCHAQETCTDCHTGDVKKREISHETCESCHDTESDDQCGFCHDQKQKTPFSHKAYGFTLDATHAQFECEVCHLNRNFSKKPQCVNCHKGYRFPAQKPGKAVRIK